MVYRPHGSNPSDADIAHLGYKAFGPRRPAFVPTPDQFKTAAGDMATGDADELADVAVEVAAWWRQDDDEEDTYWAWWGI